MNSSPGGQRFGIQCVAALGLLIIFIAPLRAAHFPEASLPKSVPVIPWSKTGGQAGAGYQGDGLSVARTESGARLHCVFQWLEADATREGLWLASTISNSAPDRFRVVAADVRRLTSNENSSADKSRGSQSLLTPAATIERLLSPTGNVTIDGTIVRFTRPGVVEEYTVSMDGVRQDFVIAERPTGAGELQVLLDVTGARVETAAYGAQLVLENSGRKIAYSRLRVTDANGRELPARMEVTAPQPVGDEVTSLKSNGDGGTQDLANSQRLLTSSPTIPGLAVVVNDTDAVYPVRIDPTFSDANWISMGGLSTHNSTVYAIAVDDNHDVYVGGTFTIIGDAFASRVAKWNGSSWSALGAGVNGNVYAIGLMGTDVYVGGDFTRATNANGSSLATANIAKWNGSSWSAMGSSITPSGLNDDVYAIAVSGTNLIVGGRFAHRLVHWTGTSWTAFVPSLPGPIPAINYAVQCLTWSGGYLYAGGEFTSISGTPMNMIARWDGTNFAPLGSGISGGASSIDAVYAISVSGSNVYAGGSFQFAGGQPATNVAVWDGINWFPLGTNMLNAVPSVASDSTNVFVGGYGRPGLWTWAGTNWVQVPGSSSVLGLFTHALTRKGGVLYGGGESGGLGWWDGTNWSRFSLGNNASVYSLAPTTAGLVVGGAFTTLRGDQYYRIARWTGSGWAKLGLGMNGIVHCVAASGSDLYAAGAFTSVTNNGGQAVAANRIARWDGANWSALGSGLSNTVLALAVSTNGLFAGGSFTNAGGIEARRIARWDGNDWLPLGSGMNADVTALCVFDGNLVAGGSFGDAGGTPASFIAQWNGDTWSPLGTGMSNNVLSLLVSGNALYAGGNFTNAGGLSANRVAKWNGNSWSNLGLGVNGAVLAMTQVGTELYVGGDFTTGGGSTANRLARWDGTNWSAVASGMNSTVRALALWEGNLFAGGSFTVAGGKVSACIARAILNEGSVLSLQPAVPGPDSNTLTFAGIPTNSYPVQFATNLTTSPWFTFATNTANANGRGTVVDSAATNDQRFYRVVVP